MYHSEKNRDILQFGILAVLLSSELFATLSCTL